MTKAPEIPSAALPGAHRVSCRARSASTIASASPLRRAMPTDSSATERALVIGDADIEWSSVRAKADRMGHTLHHQGLNLDEEMRHLRESPGQGSGWGQGER